MSFDRFDAMLLLGITLLAAGCWLAYPPAGLIVPGLILVALSWLQR